MPTGKEIPSTPFSRPVQEEESIASTGGKRKLSSSGEEWFPTTSNQPAAAEEPLTGFHLTPVGLSSDHTYHTCIVCSAYLPYQVGMLLMRRRMAFLPYSFPHRSGYLPSWAGLFLHTDYLPHSHFITNQVGMLLSRMASLLQGQITSHTRGQSGYLQCFTALGSRLRLPPNDQTICLQLSKGNWHFLRFIQTGQRIFQSSQLKLQIITIQKQSIIRTRSSELSRARSPVFDKETKLHEKKSYFETSAILPSPHHPPPPNKTGLSPGLSPWATFNWQRLSAGQQCLVGTYQGSLVRRPTPWA